MRRLLAVIPALALLLAAGCGAEPPAPAAPPIPTTTPAPVMPTPESTAGEWAGRIGIPGTPLDVGIRLRVEGQGLAGELDIPAQQALNIPLADVVLDGRNLSFGVPDGAGGAKFRGTFETDGKSIPGAFTQDGQAYPLVLRPGKPAGRPQEPRAPIPYRAEDVSFPSQDITVAGTLTLPEGPGPHPAVVLTGDGGPQNRDQEQFGHKPFLVLADTLTRAGYAVLRVDDRGVGGTGGDLAAATYDMLAGDVVAGVDYLRNRAEVDPARIGLLGHGEGGFLVPLAAQRTVVAFAVLVAAPAVTGEAALAEQNRVLFQGAGAPQQAIDQQVDFVHELTKLLRAENYDGARALVGQQLVGQAMALDPDQRPTAEEIDAQVAQTISPNYRAYLVQDPTASLQALNVPVLALYGGADVQLSAAQNDPAMRGLLAGKPDATVQTFPDLNHMMQPTQNGGLGEYATIDTTIDQRVLELVKGWLTQRFPTS